MFKKERSSSLLQHRALYRALHRAHRSVLQDRALYQIGRCQSVKVKLP